MTKHTPKASKMEPKSEVRHPLNRHSPEDPVKKGAMCNPYIIYYVSSTSALFEKVIFPSMGHPKIKEKSGLRPRLPKNIANIKQKAPKGSQRGAPGGPRVAQGLQNGSQILSKFLKKRGLCPGALQKGAKGTPGPPKNIKNEGKLTRTRAQHSQKNRDGEEVFAETRGINRASPSPKIGDGDAPHAMSSEVLSITGTGYLKARWRAGALRPWITLKK